MRLRAKRICKETTECRLKISFHLGIGLRRPSRQDVRPDFRRRARRADRRGPQLARRAGILAKTGLIVLAGEITSRARSGLSCEIARETALDIGYNDSTIGFDGNSCAVLTAIEPPVARYLAGRHRRRGTAQGTGRGRPGPDVRVRLRRDRRADAAADLARASADGEPRQAAQGEEVRLPAARRQEPGDGALCGRPPGRRRRGGHLDPAQPRRRARDAARGDDRGGDQEDDSRAVPGPSRHGLSTSIRPAASWSAARTATAV